MKFDRSNLLRLGTVTGISMAIAQSVHAASTLTGTGLANNTAFSSSHGSDLPGTPNIDVLWSPVGPGGWQAYSDGGWTNPSALNETGTGLYQLDDADEGSSFTITLTPDAGFNVILSSVDMNVYTGGGLFNIDWVVTGSASGVLGSNTYVAPTGQNSTLGFGSITGAGSEALTLDFTIGAGSGTASYLAADNLAFDQVAVPEPGTLVLGALGLGAMAMRRRRHT